MKWVMAANRNHSVTECSFLSFSRLVIFGTYWCFASAVFISFRPMTTAKAAIHLTLRNVGEFAYGSLGAFALLTKHRDQTGSHRVKDSTYTSVELPKPVKRGQRRLMSGRVNSTAAELPQRRILYTTEVMPIQTCSLGLFKHWSRQDLGQKTRTMSGSTLGSIVYYARNKKLKIELKSTDARRNFWESDIKLNLKKDGNDNILD